LPLARVVKTRLADATRGIEIADGAVLELAALLRQAGFTESLTVNVTCEAAANCVYQPET
jgi:hypothetical protein